MNAVKIECLPANLPAQLTFDVTGLGAIDDSVHLRDVPLPEGVAFATGVDPEDMVAKISALRVIEEVEEVEEAPVEEGAPEAETGAEEPAETSE